MAKYFIDRAIIVLPTVAVSPCVHAQDAVSVPVPGKLKGQAPYNVYYATLKTLKIESMQKHAEID